MDMVGRKKRVFLRGLRKLSRRFSRCCKSAQCRVIMRETCGVNLFKSRFIRGRFSATPLTFNV